MSDKTMSITQACNFGNVHFIVQLGIMMSRFSRSSQLLLRCNHIHETNEKIEIFCNNPFTGPQPLKNNKTYDSRAKTK